MLAGGRSRSRRIAKKQEQALSAVNPLRLKWHLMEFTVGSSPSAEIVVTRYDATLFPKFRVIFETAPAEGFLRYLAQPPEEADRAVVMENRADKDITALRYRWLMTDEGGNLRKQTYSSDSYMVDVYRAVLKAGDRKLISPSVEVDESFVEHLMRGGGGIGGSVGGRSLANAKVAALRLEFDMVLFADGEIAGPDTDRFAAELQCRKPAAEFVARQIRLAEAEGRDVTPVLSALAELPHLRDDFLAHWVQYYAADFSRDMHDERVRQARLRHLENRPTLPKFYRREGGGPSR